MSPARPRVAVFKLTSCDGCQLQLLDAEEALLGLAEAVDIVYFREATSHQEAGPYDVTLVEGSISTPDQLEEIKEIRANTTYLVAIGACATTGGVQALRNTMADGEPARTVYPSPEVVRALAMSTPISEHVRVDLELHGCPIDRGQLLGTLASLLAGAVPRLSEAPVCVECKRQGFVCVMVARGEPCLGPVTRTGCGALCPGVGRACYGCFGPVAGPNTGALARELLAQGRSPEEVRRRFHLITGWAPGFREAPAEAAAAGEAR